MSTQMDIGEVSKQTGLATSTLRYYDDINLIHSVGRNGLRRQFDSSVIQKLSLISLGRISGLSLEEIKGMFNEKGQVSIDRSQLLAKADHLNETIKQLTAMRDGLTHAANCPATNHLECPKFQKMLKVANRALKLKKAHNGPV